MRKDRSIYGAVITVIVSLVLLAGMFVGEVKCVIKAVQCNWDPIGKAEVIYTVSAFTPFGCIVGYLNVEDK